MKKKIAILGSTGSIGVNSLKIIEKKKSIFKIKILMAKKNYKSICNQINSFKPEIFIIDDLNTYLKIKKKYKNFKTKIFNTLDLNEKKIPKLDIVISAIPGIAGLEPTLKLIKKSKKMLIANKESIICGWSMISKFSKKNNCKIIPIDSEHYSIMKILEHEKMSDVNKIYLTASGGPFLNYKPSSLKNVKPNAALKHPKWKMGKKISIDSASLMNKILELIEAQKLFSVNEKKLDIVIHPNSLVHAIVHFKNGLYKFIYHETTMMIPLANAIFEKDLDISKFLKPKLNGKNLFFNNLFFQKVDDKKFPIIKLKKRVNEYISTPIIVNAANEIIVDQYLTKKIPFNSFYKYLLMVLNDKNYKIYAIKDPKNIEQIYEIDAWARQTTINKILND